jgi:hypothetical protein
LRAITKGYKVADKTLHLGICDKESMVASPDVGFDLVLPKASEGRAKYVIKA